MKTIAAVTSTRDDNDCGLDCGEYCEKTSANDESILFGIESCSTILCFFPDSFLFDQEIRSLSTALSVSFHAVLRLNLSDGKRRESNNTVLHFTVACLVAKLCNRSKAKVPLLWYKPCCFLNVNFLVFKLIRYWSLSQQDYTRVFANFCEFTITTTRRKSLRFVMSVD